MITSVTAAAQQVPAYCTSGHGILTPAQWQTCWNIGYNQPTTTASNAGLLAGKSTGSTAVILIAAVIVFLVYKALIAGGTRGTATSKG